MRHVPEERRVAEVLSRAWPTGVPEEEAVYLESLAADRREEALRRLRALVRSEGDPPVNLAEIARDSDLSRGTFYQLRKRWAAERSLRSITPYEERKPRSYGSGPDHDIAREAAERLIAEFPDASDGAVVRLLRSRSKLGRSTLLRLVGEARRGVRLTDVDLAATYGRTVLIGAEFMRLRVVRPGWREDPDLATCVFVVEQATGLILGHRLGEYSRSEALVLAASMRALHVLKEGRLDRAASEQASTVSWIRGPALGEGGKEITASATRTGAQSAELHHPPSLASGFAKRLAALTLPMAQVPDGVFNDNTARSVAERVQFFEQVQFRETRQSSGSILIAKAVDAHNAPILEQLQTAQLSGEHGVASGIMAASILDASVSEKR